MVTKDLGMVTAYAYAVAGGYTGTEEEFTQLMASLADEVSRIENLSVTVVTLPAGSQATASLNGSVLSLGIPRGDKGEKGDKGDTGDVSQEQLDAAVSDLKSELNKYDLTSVKEVLSEFALAEYTVESGYYDLSAPTTKKASSSYSNIKMAVSEGDFLLVTTQVVESTGMAMLIEYDSNFNYLGYVNRGTSVRTQYTDEPYIVKSGVGFITVTSIYNTPIIKNGTLVNVAEKTTANEEKLAKVDNGDITAEVTNIINNGNLESMASWVNNFCTRSLDSNVLTLTGDGTNNRINCSNITSINIGDTKYFVSVDVMVTDSNCNEIRLTLAGGYETVSIIKPVANKWYTLAVTYSYNYSGTQSAFSLNAYYEDNATQSGKVMKVKRAIGIQTNIDFGLGLNPPLYKLMNIVSMNGYWDGTKNVVINRFDIGKSLNNSENGYVLPIRNAYQSRRKPVVTFVNDDGWQDDYNKLVAVSEKYQVPFVSAIFDGSTMKEWNELYLQNELGWEFASHPENAPLADKATEGEIESAIIATNEYLTNRGLKYHNIVYPYGSHDERVRRIAKKYYRCACTTDTNGHNSGVIPSFALYRYPLGYGGTAETNSLANLKAQVDDAVERNSWLIFMLHPHMSEHTNALTQTIDDLITYIKSIGVDILTLNDGYDIFGNALECGDYIGGNDGIAISFDGQTANL